MFLSVLCVALGMPWLGVRGEEPSVHFDLTLIERLYEARTLVDLDAIYRTRSHPDGVVDLVYAMRHSALKPGRESDELLMEAIPRSPAQLWSAYGLTELAADEATEGLSNLFYDYLTELGVLVSRSDATDESMRRYLLLRVFSDGELAEFLSDETDKIAASNPTTFARVLRTLDAEQQRRICGDECRKLTRDPSQ
jgi:hypothetical protein